MGLSFTISVFNSHRQPIKKHVWACNARFLDLVTWFQTIHFTTQLPQATYQKACLGLQCQIPRSGHLVLFGQQASIVRVTRCALKRINTKSQYICLGLSWQQASIIRVTRYALKRRNKKSQYICSLWMIVVICKLMRIDKPKQKNSIDLLTLNDCRHLQAYAHWQA